MISYALRLLSLLVVGSLAADPKPPPFTYLYTINITANDEINIGQTPVGDRAGFSYAGGNFSGPLLNGTRSDIESARARLVAPS